MKNGVPETKEEARASINKIREDITKEIITSGRHYLIIAGDIPAMQVTKDELPTIAEAVRDELKLHNMPASEINRMTVRDLIAERDTPLGDYLP
jgi:hypothetical protein